MDGGGTESARPFIAAIRKWQRVGGAYDSDGNRVGKPWELARAELIDGLCQRYHCLPSELLREDASLLRMLAILSLAQPGDIPMGDKEEPSMEESLADLSKVSEGING